MNHHFNINLFNFIILTLFSVSASASGTMSSEEIEGVNKTLIESDTDRVRLQETAVLLANYEIEANKLVDLVEEGADSKSISTKAGELLNLSEHVIDSARFRLPQCDVYLSKTMELKPILSEISHEALEKDYHHDGALPKAGGECYHTKDLFVHPATVIVLTRDDPALEQGTRTSIKAEIIEVLAHTELVRQLVIY